MKSIKIEQNNKTTNERKRFNERSNERHIKYGICCYTIPVSSWSRPDATPALAASSPTCHGGHRLSRIPCLASWFLLFWIVSRKRLYIPRGPGPIWMIFNSRLVSPRVGRSKSVGAALYPKRQAALEPSRQGGERERELLRKRTIRYHSVPLRL